MERHDALRKARDKRYRQKYPWLRILGNARMRCSTPSYPKYKFYGGKGIQCLLTKDDIRNLWVRDKAYDLKQPSLDRIDSRKDYEFTNCHFIEKRANSLIGIEASNQNRKALTHCKRGHEFTPENTKIDQQGWRRCKTCRALTHNRHLSQYRKAVKK